MSKLVPSGMIAVPLPESGKGEEPLVCGEEIKDGQEVCLISLCTVIEAIEGMLPGGLKSFLSRSDNLELINDMAKAKKAEDNLCRKAKSLLPQVS